jgi:hypothetical protein
MDDMQQQGELIPLPPIRETRIFVGPWKSIDQFLAEYDEDVPADADTE